LGKNKLPKFIKIRVGNNFKGEGILTKSLTNNNSTHKNKNSGKKKLNENENHVDDRWMMINLVKVTRIFSVLLFNT